MSSQPGQVIEEVYMDYLQTANTVRKEVMGQVRPYFIVAGVFLCGGASSIFWAGIETMANLIFWGIALGLIIEFVGMFYQNKWLREEAARIARTKPGFDKFIRISGWPKKMVTGKKYEKFLEIASLSEERPVSADSLKLTYEEKQILDLLSKGCANIDIADRLGISPVNASLTTSELFRKFEVENKDELVNQAKQKGYLTPS